MTKLSKGTIGKAEENEVKELVVSKNMGLQYDLAVDRTISGDVGIRDDIDSKKGLLRGTFLTINKTTADGTIVTSGMLFSEKFSGEYMVNNVTKEVSGGEVSAPYKNTSVGFIGISNG